MSTRLVESRADDQIVIDLRDRNLAALYTWLIPGAGHMYQRRWGKGILFMVCILGTFCFGMLIGQGKVVYASWGPKEEQRRLSYFLQIGVGLPTLPALAQAAFDSRAAGGFMAPPRLPPKVRFDRVWTDDQEQKWYTDAHGTNWQVDVVVHDGPVPKQEVVTWFTVTDADGNLEQYKDELDYWSLTIPYFELGTVFTMIAGLLNVLAIWDAWGGPVMHGPEAPREQKPPDAVVMAPADTTLGTEAEPPAGSEALAGAAGAAEQPTAAEPPEFRPPGV